MPEGTTVILDNWFFKLAREAIPQPEELAEVVSADKSSVGAALVRRASRGTKV